MWLLGFTYSKSNFILYESKFDWLIALLWFDKLDNFSSVYHLGQNQLFNVIMMIIKLKTMTNYSILNIPIFCKNTYLPIFFFAKIIFFSDNEMTKLIFSLFLVTDPLTFIFSYIHQLWSAYRLITIIIVHWKLYYD